MGVARGGPLPLGPQGFKGAWAVRLPGGSSALVAGPGVTGSSCCTQVPPQSRFGFAQSLWHCLSSFFWDATGWATASGLRVSTPFPRVTPRQALNVHFTPNL